jgi:hypothetical protein
MWIMQARTRSSVVFCLGVAILAAAFHAQSTAGDDFSTVEPPLANAPAADAPVAANRSSTASRTALQIALDGAPDTLKGLDGLIAPSGGLVGEDARALGLGLASRSEAMGPEERFGVALGADASPASLVSAFASRQQFGPQVETDGRKPLNMSLSVAASVIPRALDFGFAQRTSVVDDDSGQFFTRGAEVRLGQRLEGLVSEHGGATWDRPSWYLYAASEGQALTWTPADPQAGARGSVALQDRVEIGDVQAGVTIEAAGMQGSIAYLEREVSNGRIGSADRTRSETERYVGATFTVRR